jgi:hypothetical protein
VNAKYFLLVGFLFSALTAKAASHHTIGLGLEAGLGFSNLSNNDTIATSLGTTTGSRSALGLGAHLEFQISDFFYLQPEVMYLGKGAVLNAGGFVPSKTTYRYTYIEVPLLLKIKFGIPLIHFDIFAGPSFSVAMGRDSVTDAGVTTDLSATVKSSDFGIHAGAGAEIPFLPLTSLFINGRYIIGMSDTVQNNTTTTTVKNSTLLILTGIRFAI